MKANMHKDGYEIEGTTKEFIEFFTALKRDEKPRAIYERRKEVSVADLLKQVKYKKHVTHRRPSLPRRAWHKREDEIITMWRHEGARSVQKRLEAEKYPRSYDAVITRMSLLKTGKA